MEGGGLLEDGGLFRKMYSWVELIRGEGLFEGGAYSKTYLR